MAVTGYKSPGTAASVDRDSKQLWSDPDGAKADGGGVADSFPDKDDYSDWLRLTNFGFDTGDIPSGATIDGIELKIDHLSIITATAITDSALYLRKTSGQVGDNKASGSDWPTTEETVTYGGATDTWNASLVDTDIRSTDFGSDLSIFNDEFGGGGSVDWLQIRIYYTEAGTAAPEYYVQAPIRRTSSARVVPIL